MADKITGQELARLVESMTGVRPLLSVVELDGQSLILAPTADGEQLVLGIVDRQQDSAVLALDPDAVERLATALDAWWVNQ